MQKLDPFIAVKDVANASHWFSKAFGLQRRHGGPTLAVMADAEGNTVFCLHAWTTHDHPSLSDPEVPIGNGLLLYYKTDAIDPIYDNLLALEADITATPGINPDSGKNEFSFRDPDGYHWTVSAYHEYEG